MAKRKPRFFKFTGLDGKDYSLTFQQKLFVEKYLEFKGNGVEAIIEAGYDVEYKKNGKSTGVTNRKLAAVMAYENLIKPNISAYITLKLEEYGFNDDNVAKQHLFLINQFGDLPSKRGAIDMFYKRFGKYAPTKVKIIDEYEDTSDTDLEERRRKFEEEKKRRDRGRDRKDGKNPKGEKKAKSS